MSGRQPETPGTTAPTSTDGAGRIAVLDGYRGLAVLLVVAYHYLTRWTLPTDPANHLAAAQPFGSLPLLHEFGWVGVSLFFVVSGFVILMTLERSASLPDFAIRRFARLWPPLLVGATVTTVVVATLGPAEWLASPLEFMLSLLFIPPALVGELAGLGELHWVDGAYWTLFAEVRFYALAGLVWLLAPRRLADALILYSLAGRIAAMIVGDDGRAMDVVNVLFMPDQAPFFLFGVMIYRLARADGAGGVAWKLAAAAILVFVSALDSVAQAVFAVAIMLLALGVVRRAPLLETVFARGPLSFLGRISYSVYLLHQLAGVSLLIWLTVGLRMPFGAALVVVTGLLVLAGWLMNRLVEEPGKRLVIRTLRPLAGRIADQLSILRYKPLTAFRGL